MRLVDKITLVMIGYNPANVSRRSSKGYVLRREGAILERRWGPIVGDLSQSGPMRLRWRRKPAIKFETYPSPGMARRKMKELRDWKLADLNDGGRGYRKATHILAAK